MADEQHKEGDEVFVMDGGVEQRARLRRVVPVFHECDDEPCGHRIWAAVWPVKLSQAEIEKGVSNAERVRGISERDWDNLRPKRRRPDGVHPWTLRSREDVSRILGEDADDVIKAVIEDDDRVDVIRWALEDFKSHGPTPSSHYARSGTLTLMVNRLACRKLAAMAIVNVALKNASESRLALFLEDAARRALETFLDEAKRTENVEVQHQAVLACLGLVGHKDIHDGLIAEVGLMARCLELASVYPGGKETMRAYLSGPAGKKIGGLGREF